MLLIRNLDTQVQVGMACLSFIMSGVPPQMTSQLGTRAIGNGLATLYLSLCSLSPWTRLGFLTTWQLQASRHLYLVAQDLKRQEMKGNQSLQSWSLKLPLQSYSVGWAVTKPPDSRGGNTTHLSVVVTLFCDHLYSRTMGNQERESLGKQWLDYRGDAKEVSNITLKRHIKGQSRQKPQKEVSRMVVLMGGEV